MADDKKKKAMDILIAFGPKGKPKGSEEVAGEGEGDDMLALEDAMSEFMSALEAKDPTAAASAFKNAMDLC